MAQIVHVLPATLERGANADRSIIGVAGAARDRIVFSLFIRSKVTAAHRATVFGAPVAGAHPGLPKGPA
jgi:hypothetical protein